MQTTRTPDHPINALFLERWSPRAYDAQTMPKEDLQRILEAGRWAPSAFNIQPWRFLFSLRGDSKWDDFLSILDAFNGQWAKDASALVFVLSDTVMPGDGDRPDAPARYNSFDAGAAWMQIALQASELGYSAHAMAGLDFAVGQRILALPERFRLEVGVAIGRRADPARLSADLREREAPSGRLPLQEIAHQGPFPWRSNSVAA